MPAQGMATLGVWCEDAPVNGGNQFLAFKPVVDLLKEQLAIDAPVPPNVEFEIDGNDYKLVSRRTPKEIIDQMPNINRIIDDAARRLGVSPRKAKQELYKRVIDELQKVESVKGSVFNDDEEIIMILVATDDL